MKLVASSYISNIKFEKSYDGTQMTFEAREGFNKDVLFGGYEENGKLRITINRKGLIQSVVGESRVIKIEEYINEVYNQSCQLTAR